MYSLESQTVQNQADFVAFPASWYAVHTRSNFEHRVATEFAGKGLQGYLPSYEERRQWKDRQKNITVPLFPGYLFVCIHDLPSDRLSVLKTRGVVTILGNTNGIEPVPEKEIAAVRQLLDARVNCFGHPFLREGTRVRVKRGALRGLEGFLVRIKNEARLVISVNLIGQSVAAEIDAAQAEPVLGGLPRV